MLDVVPREYHAREGRGKGPTLRQPPYLFEDGLAYQKEGSGQVVLDDGVDVGHQQIDKVVPCPRCDKEWQRVASAPTSRNTEAIDARGKEIAIELPSLCHHLMLNVCEEVDDVRAEDVSPARPLRGIEHSQVGHNRVRSLKV